MLELQFYRKLKSSFDHVLMYESKELQDKAIQCIPRERLMNNAKLKFQGAKVLLAIDSLLKQIQNWLNK